jgi:hypothetical protein
LADSGEADNKKPRGDFAGGAGADVAFIIRSVLDTAIPRKTRVRRVPGAGLVELHIAARKEWGNLLFLPVSLAVWTLGGLMVMKAVIHPQPETPRVFFALWLVGWLLGELWVIYTWLWTAFGKEIVCVTEGALTTRRDVLGYGRTHSYPIGSVRNLRTSGIFPGTSNWGHYLTGLKIGAGTVTFDSEGKTHQLGIQLTEPDAEQVVRELKPYLPGCQI